MIGLTLALALAFGALVFMSVVMTVSWLVQKKLGNAGWTDVFWTLGTGVCGVAAALWPDPYAHQPRQWLVAVLIAIWSLRLASTSPSASPAARARTRVTPGCASLTATASRR